jgi:hypothetical protein
MRRLASSKATRFFSGWLFAVHGRCCCPGSCNEAVNAKGRLVPGRSCLLAGDGLLTERSHEAGTKHEQQPPLQRMCSAQHFNKAAAHLPWSRLSCIWSAWSSTMFCARAVANHMAACTCVGCHDPSLYHTNPTALTRKRPGVLPLRIVGKKPTRKALETACKSSRMAPTHPKIPQSRIEGLSSSNCCTPETCAQRSRGRRNWGCSCSPLQLAT